MSIGHRLVAASLETGEDVTVLTRKDLVNHEKGLSYIKGDLLDKQFDFSAFVNNVEFSYHCAGELNEVIWYGISRLPYGLRYFVSQVIADLVYFPFAKFRMYSENQG